MGGIKSDLTGMIFTRLLVKQKTEKPPHRKSNATFWLCECLCGSGKEIIVSTTDLKSGHTKSCGCLKSERSSETLKKINQNNNGGGKKNKITKFYIDENNNYAYGYTSNTNHIFYIDKEDIDLCNIYTWSENDQGYIISRINGTIVRLHRMLLKCDKNKVVDHINHNTYDNRKCNLRVVSRSQNNMNKDCKGVCFDKSKQKYMAYIGFNSKCHFIGYFDTEDEAILARKNAEDKYFQEYSYTNSLKNSDIIT